MIVIEILTGKLYILVDRLINRFNAITVYQQYDNQLVIFMGLTLSKTVVRVHVRT